MFHRISAAVGRAARLAGAGALLLAMAGSSAAAQQQPAASAMAAARELIEAKGGMAMFDPLIPGVIESAKGTLLRTNTNLGKDLNEVAAQLRTEMASKRNEVLDEFARAYAEHFNEQELRAILTFYKTPTGKKMLTEEPRILDDGMRRVQAWADKLSDAVMARFRTEMKKRGHTI